jgi:hypothetical protein
MSVGDTESEMGTDLDIADGLDRDGAEVDPGADEDEDGVTVGEGDCDDTHPDIHPGSDRPVQGRDYDCDGLVEYQVTVYATADDQYDLCLDGAPVEADAWVCWRSGTGYFRCVDDDLACDADGDCPEPLACDTGRHECILDDAWSSAERYDVELEAGRHVLGFNGRDSGGVLSGLAVRVLTGNYEVTTHGVRATGTDATGWRYFPTEVEDPQVTWCSRGFDDSSWGPALFADEIDDNSWHERPLLLSHHEVDWVWDGNPRALDDAWFRLVLDLPNVEVPLTEPSAESACSASASEPLEPAGARLHNGVRAEALGEGFAVVSDQWTKAWRAGDDELIFRTLDREGSSTVGVQVNDNSGGSLSWNTFPDMAVSGDQVGVVWEDGRHSRYGYDQIYFNVVDSDGITSGSDIRLSSSSNYTRHPRVIAVGEAWVVVWQEDRGSGHEILASLVLSGDGSTPVVLSSGTDMARRPALAHEAEDNVILLVWQDITDGNRELYGRILDDALEPLTEPVRLTTTDEYTGQADLAVNSDGTFGLVYADESPGSRDIFFLALDFDAGDDTLTVAEPVAVSAAPGISSNPAIAAQGAGWVVAFRDDRAGSEAIYLNTLASDGRVATAPLVVSDSARGAINPDVAVNQSGDGDVILVTWEQEGEVWPDRYFPYFATVTCP